MTDNMTRARGYARKIARSAATMIKGDVKADMIKHTATVRREAFEEAARLADTVGQSSVADAIRKLK